jgi:hypothetical protein
MWIAGITRRPALTPNARRIQPKPALKFPARAGDTIERGTPGFTAGGFFICTGDSLSERQFAKTLTLAFLAIVEPIVANHLVVAAEHFRGVGEIEFAAGPRESVRARRAPGRCAGRPGGP